MNIQMGSHHAPKALLSFTARNVRSYWEEVHFSLVGTRLSDADVVRNLAVAGTRAPVSVLPAAGIFGANASGKSTILRAMADMRAVVLGSFRRGDQATRIHRHPFLLHKQGTGGPSRFAVDLILDGVRWQYGFEIDDDHVIDEYAYHFPKGRQALVFHRERDGQEPSFGLPLRSSGRTLAHLVRKNSLLLSVAGAATDEPSDRALAITSLIGPLFSWFRDNLLLMESDNREPRIAYTASRAESREAGDRILGLLRAADLGITAIERVEVDPEIAERVQRAFRILHGVEDDTGAGEDDVLVPGVRLGHAGAEGPVSVDPALESQGTLAWVSMIGPILDALGNGSAVLVDELDASLHPHLVQRFIGLFQSRETNPKCAQLVFNAHTPSILGDSGQRSLGRDQIWFSEKDADGATTLVALADFRPKRDDALARRYLQGRYGGVPVLDPAEFRQAADATGS